MAPTITITGIPSYDGVYPLDLEEEFFSNEELREIKLMTGVRGGELMEAVGAGDNDLVVAFAVIAVRRSGKLVHPEVFWKAQAGCIAFDAGEEEEGEESLPPTSEPPDSSDETENTNSSGASSDERSEPSPVTQLRTGIQDSDTGAASASGT